MTRDELLALLQDAARGSREMDAEIALAVLGWKLWRTQHGHWNVEGPNGERAPTEVNPFGPKYDPETGEKNPDYDKEPRRWVYNTDLPCFTESVDAALTLVPKGWHMSLRLDGKGAAEVSLYNDEHDAADNPAPPTVSGYPLAKTICIAALRARG